MDQRFSLVFFFVLSAASLMALPTQVPTEPDTAETFAGYSYRGEEIPLYFLVDSFFSRLSTCYEIGEGHQVYSEILRNKFGVDPEGPAGLAITGAMKTYVRMRSDLLEARDKRAAAEAAAATDNRYEMLELQVAALRTIYWSLTKQLQVEAPQAIEGIQAMLNGVIRGSTVIFSSDPADEAFAIASEFEIPPSRSEFPPSGRVPKAEDRKP